MRGAMRAIISPTCPDEAERATGTFSRLGMSLSPLFVRYSRQELECSIVHVRLCHIYKTLQIYHSLFNKAAKLSSERILTPSFWASSNFEPGFSPATT